MTQETRIGLLVGLVFIVMFGLVLSELTGKTSTTTTPVTVAANDDSKTVLPVLPVAEDPAPATPIATASRTDGNTPIPVADASYSSGRPPADEPIKVAVSGDSATHTGAGRPEGAEGMAYRETPPAAPGTDSGRTAAPPVAGDAARSAGAATAASTTYVVATGDNPTKIAKKFYGPTHGGDFKKILDANKITSTAGLKIGMTLVIPDIPQAAAPTHPAVAISPAAPLRPLPREATIADLRSHFSPTAPAPAAAGPTTRPASISPALARVTTPAAPASPATGSQKAYVVKAGDNLSKIARLNNTTITKILSANKDTLDSPDDLQVGDTLTIPG